MFFFPLHRCSCSYLLYYKLVIILPWLFICYNLYLYIPFITSLCSAATKLSIDLYTQPTVHNQNYSSIPRPPLPIATSLVQPSVHLHHCLVHVTQDVNDIARICTEVNLHVTCPRFGEQSRWVEEFLWKYKNSWTYHPWLTMTDNKGR